MNTDQSYNRHITILSVLYIGMSLISLLIAFGLFFLLGGIGLAVNDQVALRVLTLTGTLSACFLSITAIPSMIAGFALLAHRQWGRILALILAVFKLFNIPFGTALGIYAFWVLTQDNAETAFASSQTASLPIVESE